MELVFVREIVFVFSLALIGGFVALKLKQAPVLGFLLGGIVLSFPFFAKFINLDFSRNLAQLGIALLLFTTGIEFSIERLVSLKKEVILGSVLQIILFVFFSTIILTVFDLSKFEAFFFACAFSNSSTVILLQLLERKMDKDIAIHDTLVSWLIIQDILMVAIAIIINEVALSSNIISLNIVGAVIKSILFIGIALLLGKSIIPKIFDRVSHLNSFEILLILAFIFCLTIAYIAQLLGVSYALGAFLAGMMISKSFVNHEIFSEMRPLKDLFSVVAYVTMGSLISLPFLWSHIFKVALVFIVIILLKIITTAFIVMILDKHTRKAFMLSLMLLEGGEFSFILGQIGIVNQWISSDVYSLIIIVTVFSLLITPFIVENSEGWYQKIREVIRHRNMRLYRLLFVKWDRMLPIDHPDFINHIVICGFGRVGTYVGRALERLNIPFIVIDANAETVDYCKQRGIRIVFGDASNTDVLEKADTERAKALIIALPEQGAVEIIASNARKLNPNIKIIARSHIPTDVERLKVKGVTVTVEPEFEAAVSISKKLLNFLGKPTLDIDKYLKKSRRKQRSKWKHTEQLNGKGANLPQMP